MRVQSLGWEDPLEEEMATHSNILAWRIPWAESLVGYSHGATKSRTQLSMHTHSSRIKSTVSSMSISKEPRVV